MWWGTCLGEGGRVYAVADVEVGLEADDRDARGMVQRAGTRVA